MAKDLENTGLFGIFAHEYISLKILPTTKRIVLCGYGNINRTFHKILKEQEPEDSYTVTVCERKEGQEILSWLPLHHTEVDVVVNACTSDTVPILELCMLLGLDYIDVGIDDSENSFSSRQGDEAYTAEDSLNILSELLSRPCHSHAMLGFGINPGILEHIYVKHKPSYKHLAFELEEDDSYSEETALFGTWSPVMYASESTMGEKFIAYQGQAINVTREMDQRGPILLEGKDGKERKYLFVPHEEIYSIMNSDPNCQGSGYIFQMVPTLQQYCLDHGKNMKLEDVCQIPALRHCQGEDKVGMLFWEVNEDGTLADHNYWIYNRTANETTWQSYGENSVCWQTATGLWVAYKLLDRVSADHAHTMTELAAEHGAYIDELLAQIGLSFERMEEVFDRQQFEREVKTPYFDRQDGE